ncbi:BACTERIOPHAGE N4 ADSORPTION B PROTEIN [Salix viminalis]|uniref:BACTERIOPHAGE N4 ADSORPTION B PROTEIN n=1 Tax=Salix viminalis TaxID=40686 RepID=A0A9Q0ZJC1_SALVM|nr:BACTERIOPHAGE N4 ADSORPTION B PROTEIN [Salix viminalis]KAJ6736769.1 BACTERIOPHAGE N4 ADSORPTION B PROTEIN [Salix viminalis]KAJ6736770.1 BACTERIOPHAGE N4 ADSORPTION B PROTEIN [Salix viminalis]KAJ6736771.1 BACTERIOPHAGE N4 ADSORPTION B PROTEIN [Salix viminalis]
MPSFTAIALDRLLEPKASKFVDKSVPSSNNNYPVPKPKPPPPKPKPPLPKSNLERRNSTSVLERKANRPQMSPSLYATPESTPLPDSPSSFPPSPYIINHKRRGPRLLKSFSQDDVASRKKEMEKDEVNGKGNNGKNELVDSSYGHSVTFFIPGSVEGELLNGGVYGNPSKEDVVNGSPSKDDVVNGVHHRPMNAENVNGKNDGEIASGTTQHRTNNTRTDFTLEKDVLKPIEQNGERDADADADDFFDPQDSMSYTSNTDVEDTTVAESSMKLTAAIPAGEFYDAWEELSSGSGPHPSPSPHYIGAEFREMRLSLLMEIEKRKQAEEALTNMQNQWQRIRQELALVGLSLPAFPVDMPESGQPSDANPAEEICQQIYLARFVSESIGRGFAKAEAEIELEAQVEEKNFEIARLCDRLHYYEAVNREMCQRNQEVIEMARRNRQVRRRRRRWIFGSIAAAITLGTTALAWSYLPAMRGSPSASDSHAPEHDETANC